MALYINGQLQTMSSKIRYNESTDMVQIYYQGQWHDWKSGGANVPDGKTVTPINDVTIWQQCAGIANPTYTTLADVLADSSILSILINSNNAVDYMVRSTNWATSVRNNSNAMTDIGNDNYCANTLLADSTWRTAICNSTYFESVLNVKVPTMTSDTTPSGTIVHSRTYSSYYSWYVYSNPASSTSGTTNEFYSDADYEKYIGYDFGKSVKVYRIDAKYCHQVGSGTQTNSYKLQTSINGNNYDNIPNSERTVTTTNPAYNDIRWSDMQTVICNVNCNIVRSILTSGTGGCSWAYMQIYGRKDV